MRRLILVELEQLVLKGGEPEEVVFLGDDFRGAAALGTIDRVGIVGDVEIVVDAVAALVKGFVDVARVAGAEKQAAHGAQMIGGGSAHEMGVADAESVPERAKNGGVAVDQFARGDTQFGGGAGDVLAVLVGAGEKSDVVTLHPFEARNRIGHQRGVRRADVRAGIGVVDRGGQVERRAV